MRTRCLGGFSVMWVTKLLISPVKKGFFAQKPPNLARIWHFWPLLAHSVPCWWVGWWLWRSGCISQDTYLLYYYYYHCWLRWLCCVGGGWKRERRHQIRQWINQISNGIDHALLLFWQIVKKQKTHSRPHLQRSFLRRLSPMEALASLDQKVPLLNQSDLRQKMNLKIMSIVFCHITKVCV